MIRTWLLAAVAYTASFCLAIVAAVPTPNAGPDQVVTIPHDGTATTFVHNTLLNGSSIDPNGDPLKHWWSCPTTTPVDVGCITTRLQLNTYAGANGHPFRSYNDTCEQTYDGNHDGGARPFGAQQIKQNNTEVTSSDIVTRVLLPAGNRRAHPQAHSHSVYVQVFIRVR